MNEKREILDDMALLQSLGTLHTLPMLPSTAQRYLPYILFEAL